VLTLPALTAKARSARAGFGRDSPRADNGSHAITKLYLLLHLDGELSRGRIRAWPGYDTSARRRADHPYQAQDTNGLVELHAIHSVHVHDFGVRRGRELLPSASADSAEAWAKALRRSLSLRIFWRQPAG
jgi:hypothetical protein